MMYTTQKFDDWFRAKEIWNPWPKFSANDLEEAYEAGWNACRDKWGGMEYSDTLTNDLDESLKNL